MRKGRVLGLAILDRSILIAELSAGERPVVQRVGEFCCADLLTPRTLAQAGQALAAYLREHQFAARQAVVGIAARWLVFKPKQVPPTDAATLIPMLRLQAEAEFSSELKDLVYDFTGDPDPSSERAVVLMAAPKALIDAVTALCVSASLRPVAIVPTSVALGAATETPTGAGALVLSLATGSAELIAQRGGSCGVIRHLGAAALRPPFGELRRAVSSLSTHTSGRDLYVWDTANSDLRAMGEQLGWNILRAELPSLGVVTNPTAVNGSAGRYAAAVALVLSVMTRRRPPADFLHSRLAPAKQRPVPLWSILAGVAGALIIAFIVWTFVNLHEQETTVARDQERLAGLKPRIEAADAFVSRVSFAQAWHGGNPRYLGCLSDLTQAMPNDGVTIATSLALHEAPRIGGVAGPASGAAHDARSATARSKAAEIRPVLGTLTGKTTDQERVRILLDKLRRVPTLTQVKLGGSNDAGRGQEVIFSITFTYLPPKGTL